MLALEQLLGHVGALLVLVVVLVAVVGAPVAVVVGVVLVRGRLLAARFRRRRLASAKRAGPLGRHALSALELLRADAVVARQHGVDELVVVGERHERLAQ